jgi:hypothetical protein
MDSKPPQNERAASAKSPKIEVLPASLNDDRIRWATFYRIYTDDLLSRYARGGDFGVLQELGDEQQFPGMQPVGPYPIYIIVKNGRTCCSELSTAQRTARLQRASTRRDRSVRSGERSQRRAERKKRSIQMNLSYLDLRSRLSVSTAIACTRLIAVVAGVLWGAESLAARTAGVVRRGTRGPRTSRAGLKRNNISSATTGAPNRAGWTLSCRDGSRRGPVKSVDLLHCAPFTTPVTRIRHCTCRRRSVWCA